MAKTLGQAPRLERLKISVGVDLDSVSTIVALGGLGDPIHRYHHSILPGIFGTAFDGLQAKGVGPFNTTKVHLGKGRCHTPAKPPEAAIVTGQEQTSRKIDDEFRNSD
ncbi:hypothetical protein OLK001_18000 [Synechocystis sp. LKSZ1]